MLMFRIAFPYSRLAPSRWIAGRKGFHMRKMNAVALAIVTTTKHVPEKSTLDVIADARRQAHQPTKNEPRMPATGIAMVSP